MTHTVHKLGFVSALILLCLWISPLGVSAHGAGLTFTSTTTDGMIVDVDYGDLYMEAGYPGRFDFNLFSNAERTKSPQFTDVWVRISKDPEPGSKQSKTIFSGYVPKKDLGGTGFSILFPEGGAYTLKVRYSDTTKDSFGEDVAETEFKLDVAPSRDESEFKYASREFQIGMGSGLLIATLFAIAWYFRKRLFSK